MSRKRGLNELTNTDGIFVEQMIEGTEVLTDFETKNKYVIKIAAKQVLYNAMEESGSCNRNFCGRLRSFNMQIFDASGNEVIHLNRPLNCQWCCCPCCLQMMEISSPPGNVSGIIEQEWSLTKLINLNIKNHNDERILRIILPCCKCRRNQSSTEDYMFFEN